VHFIQELIDARDRVSILDGLPIERSIVNHHAKGAVLLLDEEHRRAIRRGAGLDVAF